MVTSITIRGQDIDESYKVGEKHPGDDSKIVTAITVGSSGAYAMIVFDDNTCLEFAGRNFLFKYYSKRNN